MFEIDIIKFINIVLLNLIIFEKKNLKTIKIQFWILFNLSSKFFYSYNFNYNYFTE